MSFARRRYFNTFLSCCLALGCALVVLALHTRYHRLEFDRAHSSSPPHACVYNDSAPVSDASPPRADCACAPAPASVSAPVEGERGAGRGAETAGVGQASFDNSEPRVYSNRI